MWPVGQQQGRKPQAPIPPQSKPPFVPQQPAPQQYPHPHSQQPKPSQAGPGQRYQQVRYGQHAGYPQAQVPVAAGQNTASTTLNYPYVEDDDDDDIIAAADTDSPETLAMAREFGKQDRANIKAKRDKLKALASPVPVPLSPEDLAEMLSRIQGEESRAVASQVSRLYQEALGHLARGASFPTRRKSSIRFDAAQRPTSTLGIILGEGQDNTCTIHDIVPGSPAFGNSKLRRGDTILQVDEEAVDRDNIVRCMRGIDIPGTMVTLQMSRPGRKRPFEVHLTRAASDLVNKKRTLHDTVLQLGAVASSQTDKKEREAAATSLVNEIVHVMKQLDHESMESEAILMGDVIDKQNSIRAMQGDLVEFIKAFASSQTDAGANSQRAWNQNAAASGMDDRSLEALYNALVQIDELHKAQCESLLSETRPRLEFLDEAMSRACAGLGAVSNNMPGAEAGGRPPIIDRLKQSLAEASSRVQELSWDAEQARIMRVAVERQLKEVEQRNSFTQLSLTAATSDYRRVKAELKLLQEGGGSRTGSAASGTGAADLQTQLDMHRKMLAHGEEERERERESMLKALAAATDRQMASEMDAAQLREDLRNMQAALDAAKQREWELELSVHELSAQEKTPQEVLGSVGLEGSLTMSELVDVNAQLARYKLRLTYLTGGDAASLESEVRRSLESLSKATEQLRDKEEKLEATARMLGEERRKVLTTRGENSWLTKQLGARMYGATGVELDLIAHFETRLAELEDLTAAESLQLESLLAKLTRSMQPLELALRSSLEMAAGVMSQSEADKTLFQNAQKQLVFEKEVLELDLARVQEKVRDAEQRTLKVVADNNELRKTLAERDQELRVGVAEKEHDLRIRKQEAEEVRVQQDKVRAQLEQLQKTNIQLTTEKETLSRERDAASAQVEELQISLAMHQEKAKDWKVREASLVKLLENVEQKSERMVMMMEETENEKIAAQTRLNEVERKISGQEGGQKELVERLKRDIAALEKEKEDARQKREMDNDRTMEVKREREVLNQEVAEMRKRLKEAEAEREVMEARVSDLCVQMEERVARLESAEGNEGEGGVSDAPPDTRIQQFQEQLRDRDERLKRLHEESSTLGQGLKAARKQLETLEKEKESAVKRAEDAAIEMKEMSMKKAEAEKTIVEIMSERVLAVAETERFRTALEEAERQRDEKFRNGDELSRLLAAAENRAQEAALRMQVEVAKMRQLETGRDEWKDKAERLSVKLKAAVEERDQASKALSKSAQTAADFEKYRQELEQSKQSIDGLKQKLESAEGGNRMLQSKLSMVAVRVRQQELEISLAISDASDTRTDLERDFEYMEAKVSAMRMRDERLAQKEDRIKVLQGDKDRLSEQHKQDAAELAKARQRADVAIEELARLRKDNIARQESTEDIAVLRQRNARLETELKESVGMQLQQLQERLIMTDRGLREDGETEDSVLEKLRAAEERNRELQAVLESEQELVRDLQALKKDTSDERQVLIRELQAAAEDVRAANLRAAGAQARMEEMQYEIEGQKLGAKAADASTSPLSGSPTKPENVDRMREQVHGLEKELRARRSSHESNVAQMQKLLSERDQLATMLKSQGPGGQPASAEPRPAAAETAAKREGDIGTFFQSLFAPRPSQPEPPARPALPISPQVPRLPSREAGSNSPMTPGNNRARPLPPNPGYTPSSMTPSQPLSVPNFSHTPSSSDPATRLRDQGDGETSQSSVGGAQGQGSELPVTHTSGTPSPTRTIIM